MTKKRTSTIEWNECGDPERPERGELALTLDADGYISIMFWRDDAMAWDDPGYGWAEGIVAWAHLPHVGQGEDDGS